MKQTYQSYYLIIALVVLLACNEAMIPNPETLGIAYFPLSTGDVRTYEVSRIDHNIDLTKDTTRYQLMEVVGASFVSGGEESYRLERYVRSDASEDWRLDSVWAARRNAYQAIVVENNVPIIKLSFPLTEGRRWDGNAMNTREYDEFKLVNLGQKFELSGNEFSQTIELVKEEAIDPTQTVSDNLHKEVFARGIGMVYRVDIDRQYCNPENCDQPGIIEFGLEVEYKLIAHQVIE